MAAFPLYYTSCLFAGLACLASRTKYHAPISALSVLSVLNHSKKHEVYPGRSTVKALDKALAHAIPLSMAYDARALPLTPHTALFWTCWLYIAYVYVVAQKSRLPEPEGPLWHASVHAASFMGGAAFFQQTYLSMTPL